MECPWCYKEMEPADGRCPHCRMEIFEPEHVEEDGPGEEGFSEEETVRNASALEKSIADRFKCAKCGGTSGSIREVAMTGTGLSKLLDIQQHHYLFVSCRSCGFVEIYDPNILRGKKAGEFGSALDFFFG